MKDRFVDYYIRIADAVSSISHARRLKVGAVLVDPQNHIVSTGYNGTAPGEDNNCEIEPENWDGDISRLKTKSDVIHAEDNLLRHLRGSAIGCTLFVTHAPCNNCANKIVSAGINRVIYRETYRDSLGIEVLKTNGIEVEQWQPNTKNVISAKQFSN